MANKKKRKPNSGLYKKEIAMMFNISVRQLTKWMQPHLDEIGEVQGKAFKPKQIKIMIEKFGQPM